MNQNENSPAVKAAMGIIGNILDLRGQNLPRPVLIRLAWFCLGAAFVLASIRPRPAEEQQNAGLNDQAEDGRDPGQAAGPDTAENVNSSAPARPADDA